jgi:hypothetical protein
VSTWAITRNDTTPQVMLDWISFNLKKMSQAASKYEDAESDECDYHRVGLSDCYAQGPFTPPAGKK